MRIGEICRAVSARLKLHNPAIKTKFDLSGDFYRNKREDTPAFSYAVRGGFEINRRRLLLLAGLLLALLFRRGKKQTKRAKK